MNIMPISNEINTSYFEYFKRTYTSYTSSSIQYWLLILENRHRNSHHRRRRLIRSCSGGHGSLAQSFSRLPLLTLFILLSPRRRINSICSNGLYTAAVLVHKWPKYLRRRRPRCIYS